MKGAIEMENKRGVGEVKLLSASQLLASMSSSNVLSRIMKEESESNLLMISYDLPPSSTTAPFVVQLTLINPHRVSVTL
ncbi:hypothetical protein HanIR_Chr17g0872391 [Helianthus annuus]|nr:hypothetical protein HanIR_Chr17g0872391 [Helianthus annuus]